MPPISSKGYPALRLRKIYKRGKLTCCLSLCSSIWGKKHNRRIYSTAASRAPLAARCLVRFQTSAEKRTRSNPATSDTTTNRPWRITSVTRRRSSQQRQQAAAASQLPVCSCPAWESTARAPGGTGNSRSARACFRACAGVRACAARVHRPSSSLEAHPMMLRRRIRN